MSLFYLSFADDDKFRGAVVVEAIDVLHAVTVATELGINPHGQVLGGKIPAEHAPSERFHNRLLNEQDIKDMWTDAKPLGEWDDADLAEIDATPPSA